LEKTTKWRFGVNRWWILGFTILAVLAVSIFTPIQPTILVAPERINEHPLFTLPVIGEFYLTNTITTMLVADLIIILIALAVRNALRKGDMVPSGFAGAMEAAIEAMYNLTESTAGRWTKLIFPWFATIIIVVLVSNLMGLIPGMESFGSLTEPHGGHGYDKVSVIPGVLGGIVKPKDGAEGLFYVVPWFRGMSTDLNFTAALALISVIATQIIGFRVQGVRYITKFFNVTTLFRKPFFGAIDFAVGLLELISEFSKILSFTFRLFGNMFAGMVLLFLMATMLPVFAPSLVMTFEFFIGLIQAFVFGMLTMVFMSQATQGHGDGHEEH
jgi:F-type H+-transporting ATPase subunit a